MKKEVTPSRKGLWIALILLIIVVAFIGYWFFGQSNQKSNSVWQPRDLTPENLPQNLEGFALVQELPDDGVAEFTVGENSYTIRKGKVSVGSPENPDISIYVPANYLGIMGQYGWCAALQSAKLNGDIRISFHGSETSLAWKYRGLFKYSECLG